MRKTWRNRKWTHRLRRGVNGDGADDQIYKTKNAKTKHTTECMSRNRKTGNVSDLCTIINRWKVIKNLTICMYWRNILRYVKCIRDEPTDWREAMGNLASSSSISICAQRTVRGKNRQELVQFFSFNTFIVWDSRQLLSTTCDQNTIASVLYGYKYDAKDCLLEGWCNRIHYASAGISHGFSQYLNRILQTKLAGIFYSLLLFIGMRKSRQFFVALIFVLFALDVPDHQ